MEHAELVKMLQEMMLGNSKVNKELDECALLGHYKSEIARLTREVEYLRNENALLRCGRYQDYPVYPAYPITFYCTSDSPSQDNY